MSTTNIKENEANNANQTFQTFASGDVPQNAGQANPMMGMGYYQMMGRMNPMGPIGQMPAGMMGYGPQNFMYVDDSMKEFAISTGAIIRQEIEMHEAVSGCETQNIYQVFVQSPMGLKYCFKCNERSGCCAVDSQMIVEV